MRPKSNTLFHFTKNQDTLKLILKNGFWPRYCLEDISWIGFPSLEFVAYPMVCFCDIPLSRISDHVDFYGEFGIGLTKEWAIKNDLNPVLYIAGIVSVGKSITNLMKFVGNINNENQEEYISTFRNINAYIKPCEGRMIVNEQSLPKEFYQESEWRYVPKNVDISDFLHKNDYENKEKLESSNQNTKAHCMLRITPSDIKYIFVKSDSDIPSIINYIQTELDSSRSVDLKILMSRVTSLESISKDV